MPFEFSPDDAIYTPSIRTRDEVERALIMAALDWTGGNQVLAAQKLGITLSTISRKMERYRVMDRGSVTGASVCQHR